MINVYEQTIVEQLMYVSWGLGIILWVRGYAYPDLVYKNAYFDFLSVLITPPFFLYILCGQPISKKYPRGVITAWAFSAQLMGWGFFVLGLMTLLLKPNVIGFVVGMIFMEGLVYATTYWITKTKYYK